MNRKCLKFTHPTRRALVAGVFILVSASLPGTAHAARSYFQSANLHELANSQIEVAGAATLTRTHRRLRATVNVTDLEPGAAYTLWWVVFNNPRFCAASQCSSGDLRNPWVGGAVFYAGGFIADVGGTGRVDASVRTGRLPKGLDYVDLGMPHRPMIWPGNGLGAVIHLVVRTHGPLKIGEADRQLGSGEFTDCELCANQLAAIFSPVR